MNHSYVTLHKEVLALYLPVVLHFYVICHNDTFPVDTCQFIFTDVLRATGSLGLLSRTTYQ